MKRIFFRFVAIVILLSSVFTSCKKEEVLTENQLIVKKIKDFIVEVKNPNTLKSTETMTVNDAVWNVEAALNYTHCYFTGNEPVYLETYDDSVVIELNITDSTVLKSDVVAFYKNAENFVLQKFNNLNINDKMISLIDVYFENNKFKVYFMIDYVVQDNLKTTTTDDCYSLDKYWYWGLGLGDAAGNCIGMDAGKVIWNHIKLEFAKMQMGGFFTSVEYWDYCPSRNWELYDYGLDDFFCEKYPNNSHDEYILSPTEMHSYLNSSILALKRIINNASYRPLGKVYCGCQLLSNHYELTIPSTFKYEHHCPKVYFGIYTPQTIVIDE